MKLIFFNLLFLIIAVIFTQCEDDEAVHREYPRITTHNVTNISNTGATFVGEIIDEGNSSIYEHGFVWSDNKNLSISANNRVLLGPSDNVGQYSAEISTTLEKDKEYYVCAFVKSGKYLVYGTIVSFKSLGSSAPTITGFSPVSAGWCDTITVTGKNFSFASNFNTVYVGSHKASVVIPISDTILKFLLPYDVTENKNPISVEISGNIGKLKDDSLVFIKPEFYDYLPKKAQWGDTISINGRYLKGFSYSQSNGIFFGNVPVKTYIYEGNIIKTLIPNELNAVSGQLRIKLNDFSFSSDSIFTLLPPRIDSIKPVTAASGAIMTIYGKFNTLASMNNILLNSVATSINDASRNELNVTIPSTLVTSLNTITLKSGPFTVVSPESFFLVPPEIKYFTPASGPSGTLVKIGGKYLKSGATSVSFGTASGRIKSINDSVIYCYAPALPPDNYKIHVKVCSSTAEISADFAITNLVEITGFSQMLVSYYDIVTLYGKNLNLASLWQLGNNQIYPISVTSTELKFYITHDLLYYTPLQVTAYYDLNGVRSFVKSTDYLTLKDFTIKSITPLSCSVGEIVTIEGENFNPSGSAFSVKIGTVNAGLNYNSLTEIRFVVPKVPDGSYDITVTSAGKSTVYTEQIYVINP